jgi:undecaprenyl-diphosphatase
MNDIQGLDSATDAWFHFQRGKAPHPLMEAANLLSGYPALAALALAIMGLLLYLGRQRQAGAFGVLVVVAVVLGEGLRLLVGRQGPQMSPSFPNVSALLTSMLLLILAMVLSTIVQGRLRFLIYAACLVLVLLIGASQLYLSLHFLTDLLAGWTAGVLLALIWDFIVRARAPSAGRASEGG